jgi:hypothetical protein
VAAADDALIEGFRAPPQLARPRIWWHWLAGNVTEAGITRDLEWMQRIGIAGFQMFDADFGAPALVEKPIGFMDDRWVSLVRHTSLEAHRLGIEMSLAAPGMMESGGPWVKPEQAMKKLVWSEMTLQGGERFNGVLPAPPSVNGPIADMPNPAEFVGAPSGGYAKDDPRYYADIRVIAYRLPLEEKELRPAAASASSPIDNPSRLWDGRLDEPVVLRCMDMASECWLQFDFGKPTTIRSLQIAVDWRHFSDPSVPQGMILASDDGASFRELRKLPEAFLHDVRPGEVNYDAFSRSYPPVFTLALPETKARYFRLRVEPGSRYVFHGQPRESVPEIHFTEANFSSVARPERFEAKAGFAILPYVEKLITPDVSPGVSIDPRSVIDITHLMRPGGKLRWTPPSGAWRVIRFGYSLTGRKNDARPAAQGLEVDKYSAVDVRHFLESYFDPVLAAVCSPDTSCALRNVLLDSWEAGQANWTPQLLQEFTRRRGYDPTPYLPVLADHIVGSAEQTERFLWDFRRTLADLLAENHAGTIAAFAKERGLGFYGEVMGLGLPTMGDGLQQKRFPTVPMAEFWHVPAAQPSAGVIVADLREAASAGHVFGRNVVAAEAFTALPVMADYTVTPWKLKPIADRALLHGINQFVIHTAVHQPFEQGPGVSLGPYGQHFNRHETWAELAKPWMDYLARASYLLQQGRYVADIAYFYGEGAPITVPENAATDPAIPNGYGFDFLSRDMVLQDLSVANGRLVTSSGMSYRILVLPASTERMSFALIQKLRQLVEAGAVVVGPRPTAPAGLGDSEVSVASAARELWADLDGRDRNERAFGKGRVYWGIPLAQVLKTLGAAPDYAFTGEGARELGAIHRRFEDSDIYWVANQSNAPARVEASLRIQGKEAEIWHADTGARQPASYLEMQDRTQVPLELGPYESVFVVFQKPARAAERQVLASKTIPVAEITGDWEISFEPGRGAPPSARVVGLRSWTESADPGVRYFSGVGTYIKQIEIQRGWLSKGRQLILDLGRVAEVARVSVNGRDAGGAWKPPYRVDITDVARPGMNTLKIEVANVWANRLIGDLQPGAAQKYAFTTNTRVPFTPTSPLVPAGLLGPVRIFTASPARK